MPIISGLSKSDLDIPGDLRLRAARATQGSPYMLQLIGYNIGNRCKTGEHVTPEQVDGAIEASEADFENDVCETTLAALSDQDVAFLDAMTDDEDAVSRISDVAKRMSVTPDYAQKVSPAPHRRSRRNRTGAPRLRAFRRSIYG